MSNLQSIYHNHGFTERSMPLHFACCVLSFDVGFEVTSDNGAALPNDCLAVQLPYQSHSLFQLQVFLIVIIANPQCLFISTPAVSSDNIVVGTSTQIRRLINHQTTGLLYSRPTSFSFSYFVR
jgi:hypothetical protein